MNSRIKLNVRILPVLVVILLFMQLIDPSRTWTILLAGLGGIWLVAFAWAHSLKKNLSMERQMRYGWMQVGDSLEEKFSLRNDGILPATWVEVEDHSTLPGYLASVATGVDSDGENEWHTRGTCNQRGLFWLGDTSLHTGDPFGIYTVSIEDKARAMMIVMPPVVPLPNIEIAPGGFMGEGRPRPDAPEPTVSTSGVREYAPGDSIKIIHWPTTARLGKPYVRLFEGAPAGDWWVLLDLDQSVQLGKNEDSTVENGVILAASLADRGLRARKAVGLTANAQELLWLPPRTGEPYKWEVLRALALVQPGQTGLAEMLERIRPNLGRRSSLLLITPNPDPAWLNSLIPLSRRNIVPTALLLDPISFGGDKSMLPLAGMLAEMGISHNIITRDMLNRPEARPGHQGQWEWRITPRGRAIPVRAPGDAAWRRLG